MATSGVPLADRVLGFGTTIFTEMSALAAQHGAVNLGQGFPDFDGPDSIKQAAIQAIQTGRNQYAVMSGASDLRQAIAAHSARFYGMAVDPEAEVTVTSGATEAIFAAVMGLVNPGDEVIVIEPFYDSYVPAVVMAGGVPVYVPLRGPDWRLEPEELTAGFGPRTRLLLLNTPHNPTGKVFTEAELALLADLCRRWNVICISDEVYEHIVFPPARHVRMAAHPGMEERTVTISSQGKTFSFTGWKLGWAIAPPHLTLGVRRAHQFITFASAAPLQAAAAFALGLDDEFYQSLAAGYQARRDFLASALESVGLKVSLPGGTYFIMADITPLGFEDDAQFCRWLTSEVGVAAIPPSFFYSEAHKPLGQTWARFAFCKRQETLEAAAARLKKVRLGGQKAS